MWGSNRSGQLGTFSNNGGFITTPRELSLPNGGTVIEAALGFEYTALLLGKIHSLTYTQKLGKF